MADGEESSGVLNVGVFPSPDDPNPLKTLYPMVDEEKTALPRSWSGIKKHKYIGLSQKNLRVSYKGPGKSHKDAASVLATHSIPTVCGLYYFEVRIISKGREGYMGIGLSSNPDIELNRLPGWEKNSYGYHGDDGHGFCSSGTGKPYGPTFTTADVIGCGVNLFDRTCFYTKNGVLLGTAFRELPLKDLYPTVGLQTPGEVVEVNFGCSGPFLYDLRPKMLEARDIVRQTILNYPLTVGGGDILPTNPTVLAAEGGPQGAAGDVDKGKWTEVLNRMVSGYLVHHAYCDTAEAFSRATNIDWTADEDISSIKKRQRISKQVMTGDVGGSIAAVEQIYPNLLLDNPNLRFMLMVRQFIEIVKGTEQQQPLPPPLQQSPSSSPATNGTTINGTTDNDVLAAAADKIRNHTSVIQSTKFALSSSAHLKNNSSKSWSNSPAGETLEQLNQRNTGLRDRSPFYPTTIRPSGGGGGGGDDTNGSSSHEQQQPLSSASPSPPPELPSSTTSNLQHHLHEHTITPISDALRNDADSDAEMEYVDERDPSSVSMLSLPLSVSIPSSSSAGTTAAPPVSSTATSASEGGGGASGSSGAGASSSVNGVSNGFNRHGEEDMIVDDDEDEDEGDEDDIHNSGSTTNHQNGSGSHSSTLLNSSMNGSVLSNGTDGTITNGTGGGGGSSSSSSSSKGLGGGCSSSSSRRRSNVERLLSFGRELQCVSQLLRLTHGKNKSNKRMLQDAFSLLAYNDPAASPVGWQLDASQRESVCMALNSAILEAQNQAPRSALEVCAGHSQQLVGLMSRSGLGAAAFTPIQPILDYQAFKDTVATQEKDSSFTATEGGVACVAAGSLSTAGDRQGTTSMETQSPFRSSLFRSMGAAGGRERRRGRTLDDDDDEDDDEDYVPFSLTSLSRNTRMGYHHRACGGSGSGGSGNKRSSSRTFRFSSDLSTGFSSRFRALLSDTTTVTTGVGALSSGTSSSTTSSSTAATTTTTAAVVAARVSSVIASTSSGATLATSTNVSNHSEAAAASSLTLAAATRNSSLPLAASISAATTASVVRNQRNGDTTGGNGSSTSLDLLRGAYEEGDDEDEVMDESDELGGAGLQYDGSNYEEDFILKTTGSVMDFMAAQATLSPLNRCDGSASISDTRTSSAFPQALSGRGSGEAADGLVSGSDGDYFYDYMTGGGGESSVLGASSSSSSAAPATNVSSSGFSAITNSTNINSISNNNDNNNSPASSPATTTSLAGSSASSNPLYSSRNVAGSGASCPREPVEPMDIPPPSAAAVASLAAISAAMSAAAAIAPSRPNPSIPSVAASTPTHADGEESRSMQDGGTGGSALDCSWPPTSRQ